MLNLLQIAVQNQQIERWKEIGRQQSEPAKIKEPPIKPIIQRTAVHECDASKAQSGISRRPHNLDRKSRKVFDNIVT